MNHKQRLNRIVTAGVLLGIGMGGFVDGIVFHQILQLHNMLSAVRPKTTIVNVEVNMFWDGLFHAFTWLMTAAGLWMLWHNIQDGIERLPGRVLFGSMLLGWGLFNAVEGTIDHHILGIHHVVEQLGVSIYDYLFLASGIIFIAGGSSAIKAGLKQTLRT